MVKIKKKKVLVLKFQLSRNFTLEYISFWQCWLNHIYLQTFEPHKSLSSYFERKNAFSTLFQNCGNYHWAGSSRGERHLFEVPIYLQPTLWGRHRNSKLGLILLPREPNSNLKFERKSQMWILQFGSFTKQLPLPECTQEVSQSLRNLLYPFLWITQEGVSRI